MNILRTTSNETNRIHPLRVIVVGALGWIWLINLTTAVAAQDRPAGYGEAGERQSGAEDRALVIVTSPAHDQITKLMSLYELSPDELRGLAFAEPISAAARNTLWRVFRALRQCATWKWVPTQSFSSLSTLPNANSPAFEDWTGQFVRVVGQLQKIESAPLPIDLQESFGATHYHRCEIILAGSDTASLIYTLQVPDRLLASADDPREIIGQRVSCWGLLTAVDSTKGSGRVAIVTDRLRWIPTAVNEQLGVDKHHLWLAAQGVDLDALSAIADGTEMSSLDRTSFYQLLSAAQRWDSSVLEREKITPINIGKMLKQPELFRGRLYHLRGVARRIVQIDTDNQVAAEFGMGDYFEMEIMTEVEPSIRIEAGDKSRLFARYPVVACAVSLPKGMSTGENVHEPMEFTGVFLKNWAYPSAWLSAADARFHQSSPLLIGQQPVRLSLQAEDAPSERLLNWFAMAIVLGVVLFGWQVARWNRQMAARRRALRAKAQPPNWDELEL